MSKVQHIMGQKTGCNRSRPVFFGFSIFWQTLQLATKKIQNLCNCNRWSGLLQLGSVRFRSFFQSSELDLWTLYIYPQRKDGATLLGYLLSIVLSLSTILSHFNCTIWLVLSSCIHSYYYLNSCIPSKCHLTCLWTHSTWLVFALCTCLDYKSC